MAIRMCVTKRVYAKPVHMKKRTCRLWAHGSLISELPVHVNRSPYMYALSTCYLFSRLAYWILEITLERGPGIEVFNTGLSYS